MRPTVGPALVVPAPPEHPVVEIVAAWVDDAPPGLLGLRPTLTTAGRGDLLLVATLAGHVLRFTTVTGNIPRPLVSLK